MRTDRLALLPAPDGSADSSSADGSGGSGGGGGCGRVPPDSVVEAAYHEHLVHSEGQHIDLSALYAALKGSGAALLAAVASDWRLNPNESSSSSSGGGDVAAEALLKPMWRAMLRFVGRATAPRLWQHGWSPAQWACAKQGGAPPGVCPEGGLVRRNGGGADGSARLPWIVAMERPNWWRSRSQLRGPGPSCRHGAARLGGARVGATSVAA